MKPDLGIKTENREKVIEILTNVLADANVLYIKLRKFHWNISGDNFMEYHLLFEEQYSALEEKIDEIAERISTIGGIAIGTTKEFGENTRLEENPGEIPAPKEMVKILVKDHESIIKALRKDIAEIEDNLNDVGSADFLTGLIQEHEKMSWKLRRYFRE